jgi:pimeloyl-ACP methyl ester carboxylesterase
MAFEEFCLTVKGCRTHFMRGGSGEPLLFLHGASGAGEWLPFMETLSERYDVIVPEHPGFGASDTPDWLDNIGDVAFFYLDVIDELGLDKVHLAGGSLGGWIAAELATRSCEKIKSLTLIAPAGIHVKGVAKGDMFMWSPEELMSNLFYDQSIPASMTGPANDEELLVVLKNRLMTAKLGWHPRMYNPDLRKWLHRVRVPTLIIWGAEDKLIPVAYGSAYRELIPGSRLEVIAECGHLPQVEKAGQFTQTMTDFIQGVA